MNNFLESSDGSVPLIIFTLSWLALLVALVIFRRPISTVLKSLSRRVEGGAPVKIGSLLEVGQLVTSTDALTDRDDSVKVWGDPDQMLLLFKAQGRGWKKSTKAMQIEGGCLVQVTTERQSADGDWASAEALQFIPGVIVLENPGGEGRSLAPAQ